MKYEIETFRLGDICEVVRGGSPRPIIDYITDDEDGVNWLKIGDVNETDKYFTHANERIKRSGISKTREVKSGDLILSNSMSFGRAFITLIDGYIHDGWLRLRCDESTISKEYLYYFLTSSVAQNQFKAVATGSVVNNLKADTVRDTLISVPPLNIQEKIVAVLGTIDKKIVLNNQINNNLEQQATALFKSWFVDFDPWDGQMPTAWSSAPLGSFVDIRRGGSPRPIQDYLSDEGLRWLKISDVTSLSVPYVLDIKEHIREEGLKKTVFLKAGELVLSNSATPGIPKILDVDSCIHDGWLYFPKSELSKYFLYLLFKHIRKELIALGNGSVFTNLKTDILKAYPISKADKDTLNNFDQLVIPLFNAMLNLCKENHALVDLRNLLIQKMMSGEIDVSEVDI